MIPNTLNSDKSHFLSALTRASLYTMKKLLITTDFSNNAKHAAEYGYTLAKQIKAGIFLCNTVTIPAETSLSGMVAWPMEQSDILMEGSIDDLKRLKAHLEQHDYSDTFRPPVDYLNETGIVWATVNNASTDQKVDMVIAGSHQKSGINTFLMGNHTRDLIDACIKPLLIIPETAAFKPIRKIAFASDFKSPETDLEEIYQLISFARLLDAEILLTHIYNEKDPSHRFEKGIKQFLSEISNKADYPQIYYRVINESKIESGLDWLCQIDILAMVHRKHGFFDNLLNGSYTHKMANHISIPLLVYPGK
jgi:nucleotide-binding universal stress UspA family protein